MQYKPLQSGQTPGLGMSGDAVKTLQQNYNAANPTTRLVEDGLYGPKTQAALNPSSSLIVNSNSAKMQGMKDGSDLNTILNNYGLNQTTGATGKPGEGAKPEVSDAYTSALDQVGASSDLATQRLISEIKATRQNSENKVNENYDNYKRGLQLIGIQHNESTFSPDLLTGKMQQVESEHQSKIQDLRREETKALLDANQAKVKGDLATLKEKMDYVRQLKQDQVDELKGFYDTISQQDKTAEIAGAQMYDVVNKELKNLNPDDQEAFLQAVSKKFNIPLAGLVKGIATEKERRDKVALETVDKKSIIAKRNSTGNGPGKATVKTASAEIGTKLKSEKQGGVLGDDGYMDPSLWVNLRDQWIINSLPVTTFNTLYKKYLNPLSYDKAGFDDGI